MLCDVNLLCTCDDDYVMLMRCGFDTSLSALKSLRISEVQHGVTELLQDAPAAPFWTKMLVFVTTHLLLPCCAEGLSYHLSTCL